MRSRSRRLLCLAVMAAAVTVVALVVPSLASAGDGYGTNDADRPVDHPGNDRHRQSLRRLHDARHLPLRGARSMTSPSRARTSARTGTCSSTPTAAARRSVVVLADQRARSRVHPVSGRPAHGRDRRGHLHRSGRERTEPAVRDRVADDLLPALGDRQLRGHPFGGHADALGHLRRDSRRRRAGDERDPGRRSRPLHAVLLR